MHTVKVVGAGLGLLALCLLAGRSSGGRQGMSKGAVAFLPLWLLGSGINMYAGMKEAGYSAADELPVAVGVFGGPALVAVGLRWKLQRL